MVFTLFLTFVGLALQSSYALVARTACADGVHTAVNPACCKWMAVRDLMIDQVFDGDCGEEAHSTIRIAFHDAAGFSIHGGKGNGADGSIIAFGSTELNYAANAGIDDIVDLLKPFADQNHISYGDVIQFGSSVALSLCPGSPIVKTFVGRPNATVVAPDGTLPDPNDVLVTIFARFADMGFSDAEVVALLASHTVAAQDQIEPSIAGSPFDSTPGQFDSQLFLETLLRGTAFPGDGTSHVGQVASGMQGEFRLLSDHLLARDSRTSCTWQSFALNQSLMAKSFAAAMAKLAVLGQNTNNLVDCTEAIPAAAPASLSKAYFPAGTDHSQIEQACATQLFPTTLSTQSGPPTPVAQVPARK